MDYNFSPNAGLDSPAIKAAAVTLSDSTDLTVNGQLPRALYIGTGGTLALKLGDDSSAVSFTNVPNGTLLPVRAKNAMSTGSSGVSGVIALY